MLIYLKQRINIKGELFTSTFTYGVSAVFRLASSLVLTRLLTPEAYGIFGILCVSHLVLAVTPASLLHLRFRK
jgi:hypothetical protein